MPEILEVTIDKFTFRVPTDRVYNEEGLWALVEGDQVRVGLADFIQQSSGDVAFATVKPEGTVLAFGDELMEIETIKVTIELNSPVTGIVSAVNPTLEGSPEIINADPYGKGWVALIEPHDWEGDRTQLLDAASYFDLMKAKAEEEAKKL